jgi:iron-sulfur cluster repair protein YtfE (RIC family)
MPFRPTSPEWLDFHRERRRHLGALDALDEHLARAHAPDAAWTAGLGERLADLVRALHVHYSHEEEGALYTSVPREHPELSRSLLRLVAEHDEILDELDALLTATKAGETTPEARDRIALNAQRVAARIRRHEAEEEEIQLRAVCEALERDAR